MQFIEGRPYYSASDLNNYLECAHLTTLDMKAALHDLSRPPRPEGTVAIIAQLGMDHERAYLQKLRDDGFAVTDLPDRCPPTVEAMTDAETATLAAMSAQSPIIYQGAFFDGTFMGRTDFLFRVPTPSARWASHSYEVLDTKLALHTKPYFLLQLCHYSEHLERIQGTRPEFMHVLLGNGQKKSYRVSDYLAYYKQLKRGFLRDVANADPQTYPVPTDHCDVCSWDELCTKRRRDDDYLRLVAWMGNAQVARFALMGITTVAQLAGADDSKRPARMGAATFYRLRNQAALQMQHRETGAHIYKILDHPAWTGFGLLPAPANGDVFFDMEGDPLFEIGVGLEYLFGCWMPDDKEPFKAFWGLSRRDEKSAFQNLVDFITARLKRYPRMHVYHYASYETTALTKLAQRHLTRENDVDDLLRAGVFVDLYTVVRQALMISQEGYSIKKLEPFYGFERSVDLRRGDDSIVMFEKWRLTPDPRILEEIYDYNRDDCESTQLLRDWLLSLRDEYQTASGVEVPFKSPIDPEASCHEPALEECKKCQERLRKEREEEQASDTERALLDGLPDVPTTIGEIEMWKPDPRDRFRLAHLMAYHRRERKPVFWKYFHRCNNVDELVEFDKDCLGGLELDPTIQVIQRTKRENPIYTYRFPEQDYDLTKGKLMDPLTKEYVGENMGIDEDNNRIPLKLSNAAKKNPGSIVAVVPLDHIDPKPQRLALQRIGAAYLDGSLASYTALMDILQSNPPRLTDRALGSNIQPERVDAEALFQVISHLDSSALFVQGPPGTGKSTKAGIVIARLLAAGKTVGVMSTAHKAIHGLDKKVEDAAKHMKQSFRGAHKASKSNEGSDYVSEHGFICTVHKDAEIDAGDFQFISGNGWLFARPEMDRKFDYLFIDEAGQIALADALSVAQCARNIVLIGDPLQLAQVSQGTHPVGAGGSVLEHLLGVHATVPPNRGVFLNETYRLHPTICSFVSDAIYEGRLKPAHEPDANTELHSIGEAPEFGSGLRYIPIKHSANSRESDEEAERVVEIVGRLIGSECVDGKGRRKKAGAEDLIIVSPYNAQRHLIKEKLAARKFGAVPVGTVDKFQGQEAFAVIYSMATSSEKEAPRGLGFLLDRNRFNVAISRCQALAIVVCSESLIEARCNNVADMGLMSLLCSYAEAAS